MASSKLSKHFLDFKFKNLRWRKKLDQHSLIPGKNGCTYFGSLPMMVPQLWSADARPHNNLQVAAEHIMM